MGTTSARGAPALRRRLRRVPRAGRSDRAVLLVVRWLTALAICAANLVGTVLVFVILMWVLPSPPGEGASTLLNLVVAGSYLLIALPIGVAWGLRRLRPSRRWLEEGRPPTLAEQRNLLRSPLVVFFTVGTLWLIAGVLFGTLNALDSFEVGRRIGIAILLAGLATGAIAYLLTEWLLRPAAARTLAARPLEDTALPGVTARTLFTWSLGSGVPMLGLAIVGLEVLVDADLSRGQLAVAVLALTATGLLVGFLATFIAARVTADPVLSLRHAVGEVERGDLDVEVPVYDGTELGLLQSGFNRMVAGLRERERIRDLFGRHVGEEVAREALRRESGLGGEVREVAILFIDMEGSTRLAASRPPTEVVEILNDFFGIVVETVAAHGGWVNKFEGDAALAVFGAPQELEDAAGRALAAAREIHGRLAETLPGVRVGIGVAYGEVVAGNVGAAERFEYTVIGDAVNEAARLSELAKRHPGGVLGSQAAREHAIPKEAARWQLGEEVELRGRSRVTRLACPQQDVAPAGRASASEAL